VQPVFEKSENLPVSSALANAMNVRVLVATANSDEVLFLQEVLEDIQTERYWRGWVSVQALMAVSLDDAIALLTDEAVDAVVLDVELCGGRAIDAFRRLQAAAPYTPVILIAGQEDTEVAVRLVREGAQDFLIARSVDAVPLAHALGTAIERQRLLSGARAACMEDPFTGLLNRTAFLALADRDRKLAEKLGCRWMIVMAEPSDFGAWLPAVSRDKENITAERRDLLLIEAAERLRRLAGPTDLLARVGDCRFGLGIFDTAGETLESAWSRIHSTACENRIAIGAAIFDFSHPAPLEALIEQAEMELTPKTMTVRT
jgi:DNA-binding NarL/FixJ family response regulator